MAEVLEVFIPISFFALVVLVVFFTAKYNYQIKKAILDKGGDIQLAKRKFPFIELGLTIGGVGLGLAVAVIPQNTSLPKDSIDLLIGACILLFGGLGLVSGFFMRRKLDEQK